jgi:hypothetical protein
MSIRLQNHASLLSRFLFAQFPTIREESQKRDFTFKIQNLQSTLFMNVKADSYVYIYMACCDISMDNVGG